jgi:hypothetical protein
MWGNVADDEIIAQMGRECEDWTSLTGWAIMGYSKNANAPARQAEAF